MQKHSEWPLENTSRLAGKIVILTGSLASFLAVSAPVGFGPDFSSCRA
jgi:hypothetical protein